MIGMGHQTAQQEFCWLHKRHHVAMLHAMDAAGFALLQLTRIHYLIIDSCHGHCAGASHCQCVQVGVGRVAVCTPGATPRDALVALVLCGCTSVAAGACASRTSSVNLVTSLDEFCGGSSRGHGRKPTRQRRRCLASQPANRRHNRHCLNLLKPFK